MCVFIHWNKIFTQMINGPKNISNNEFCKYLFSIKKQYSSASNPKILITKTIYQSSLLRSKRLNSTNKRHSEKLTTVKNTNLNRLFSIQVYFFKKNTRYKIRIIKYVLIPVYRYISLQLDESLLCFLFVCLVFFLIFS